MQPPDSTKNKSCLPAAIPMPNTYFQFHANSQSDKAVQVQIRLAQVTTHGIKPSAKTKRFTARQ